MFRSLGGDSNGNVAVVFALCAVLVIAAGGGAVDFMRFAKERAEMQEATDAAALAAVRLWKAPESERTKAAQRFFASNHRHVGALVINVAYAGEAATVTAKNALPTTLLAVIGKKTFDVVSVSTATRAVSKPICMLALDKNLPNGFEIYGSAKLTGVNCAAASNSRHDMGMRTYGKATATAAQFGVVGGFDGEFSPPPEEGIEEIPDPYAALRLPPPGECIDFDSKLRQASFSIEPGTYCGGIDVKAGATVKLNPGLYIVKDGPFTVQSGAAVEGDGVVVGFTGKKSTLYLQGRAKMRLTAPTEGTFQGIVLFSESTSSNVEWATISGGATLDYVGDLYLPTHELWLKSPDSEVAQLNAETMAHGLIAKRIWVQGSSELKVTRTENDDTQNELRFKYGSRLIR